MRLALAADYNPPLYRTRIVIREKHISTHAIAFFDKVFQGWLR